MIMKRLLIKQRECGFIFSDICRLRVVSNFGDSGEIHASARKWAPARTRAMREAGIAKIRDYIDILVVAWKREINANCCVSL